MALQGKVLEEVIRCREKEVPPVLNQKEFAALAESIEDGDINDPEELSLGTCIHVYSVYMYMYVRVHVRVHCTLYIHVHACTL